ncbi:MAG: DUF2442 domain-containing protein [Pedosphaera sp.]|nr:DUF2442 domain-containing protein [Pedosphaera sp.]
MKALATKYLEIVQAGYVSGYKIRLTFNDGLVRVMDFEPFLRKALNPDITKYRQFRNFKKFHLHYGDLMWGDFDMIFPITDLHRGNILKGEEAALSHFVLNDTAAPAKPISDRKTKIVSYQNVKRKKVLHG